MAASSPISIQLAKGTILHGKSYDYEVTKVLGEGSFGITYLATVKMKGELGSIDSNMKVALKEFFMHDINGREEASVTNSSSDGVYDQYMRKFVKEAKALSKVKHPNVVKVVECFEANNTVYYSMEFLNGGSLDDMIYDTNGDGLSEAVTLKYVSQIASALSYLHSKMMLHLDLKPSNIMLRDPDTIALIDFGLAKQFDSSGSPESSTTIGGGTPGYAPIEQATYNGNDDGNGLPVTMDVYALGATMYKMLTGQLAPVASDILNDGFPEQELVDRNISPEVIAVVRKAMEPLRKNRFQTIGDMYRKLRPLIPKEQRRKMFDGGSDEAKDDAPKTKQEEFIDRGQRDEATLVAPVSPQANGANTTATSADTKPQQKAAPQSEPDLVSLDVPITESEPEIDLESDLDTPLAPVPQRNPDPKSGSKDNGTMIMTDPKSKKNADSGNSKKSHKKSDTNSTPADNQHQTSIISTSPATSTGGKSRPIIIGALALAVIGLGILAYFLFSGGNDNNDNTSTDTVAAVDELPTPEVIETAPDVVETPTEEPAMDQTPAQDQVQQPTAQAQAQAQNVQTAANQAVHAAQAAAQTGITPDTPVSVFGGAATYDKTARTITFNRAYTLDLHTFDNSKVNIPAGAVLEKVVVSNGYLRQGRLTTDGTVLRGLEEKL